jgi:hypothetical protein
MIAIVYLLTSKWHEVEGDILFFISLIDMFIIMFVVASVF